MSERSAPATGSSVHRGGENLRHQQSVACTVRNVGDSTAFAVAKRGAAEDESALIRLAIIRVAPVDDIVSANPRPGRAWPFVMLQAVGWTGECLDLLTAGEIIGGIAE